MRHLVDAPPARPRSRANIGAGEIERRGNHILYPSPAPVFARDKHQWYELPDGQVIALEREGKQKKMDRFTVAERKREQTMLHHQAVTRQLAESRRAAASLKQDARRLRPPPDMGVRYNSRPKLAETGDALPRFTVGDRIEVNLGTAARSHRGSQRWQPGRVIEINVHAPHFPTGHTMPYLVGIDVGGVLTIPVDDDLVIRKSKTASSHAASASTSMQTPTVASTIESLASARLASGIEHAQKQLQAQRRMPPRIESALATAIRTKVHSSTAIRNDDAHQWLASQRSAPAVVSGDDDPFIAGPTLSSEESAECRAALGLAQQAFAEAPVEAMRTATAGGVTAVCRVLTTILGTAGQVPAPRVPGDSAAAVIAARAKNPEAKPSVSESSEARGPGDYRVAKAPPPEEMDDPEVARAATVDALKMAMLDVNTLTDLTRQLSVGAPDGSAEADAAELATLAATAVNHARARRARDGVERAKTAEGPNGRQLSWSWSHRPGVWWSHLDRVLDADATSARSELSGPHSVAALLDRVGAGSSSFDGSLSLNGRAADGAMYDQSRSMDAFLQSDAIDGSAGGGGEASAGSSRPRDMLDELNEADGRRLKARLGLDGRERTVAGTHTSRRHLTGMRWDDGELARLSALMEAGAIQVESLDVQAPNTVGTRGIKALCRALLIGKGAPVLTALRVRADRATDEDMRLLGATLSMRTSAVEIKQMLLGGGDHANEGSAAKGASRQAGGAAAVTFLAAPNLHTIDIDGGKCVSSYGRQIVAAARRARQALAPPSEAEKSRLAKAATKVPAALDRFRRAIDVGESNSAVDVQARRALFQQWDGNGSGAISLAELGTGILGTLTNAHAKAGNALYHRFYRLYIRAFNDTRDGLGVVAQDAAADGAVLRSAFRGGGEYITLPQFNRLLNNLRQYAVWYEVFMLVDGGTRGRTVEDDHRLSRAEWTAALEHVRQAGHTWAPFAAFANATESDFDVIDRDRGGFITFDEWVRFVRASEDAATEAAHQTTSAAEAKRFPPPPPHPSKEAFVVRNGRLLLRDEIAVEARAALVAAPFAAHVA